MGQDDAPLKPATLRIRRARHHRRGPRPPRRARRRRQGPRRRPEPDPPDGASPRPPGAASSTSAGSSRCRRSTRTDRSSMGAGVRQRDGRTRPRDLARLLPASRPGHPADRAHPRSARGARSAAASRHADPAAELPAVMLLTEAQLVVAQPAGRRACRRRGRLLRGFLRDDARARRAPRGAPLPGLAGPHGLRVRRVDPSQRRLRARRRGCGRRARGRRHRPRRATRVHGRRADPGAGGRGRGAHRRERADRGRDRRRRRRGARRARPERRPPRDRGLPPPRRRRARRRVLRDAAAAAGRPAGARRRTHDRSTPVDARRQRRAPHTRPSSRAGRSRSCCARTSA